jgi:MoxR-like ATPase
VKYPSLDEEVKILQYTHSGKTTHFNDEVSAELNAEDIHRYREIVARLHIEEKVLRYIAELTNETRNNKAIFLGGSPRLLLQF